MDTNIYRLIYLSSQLMSVYSVYRLFNVFFKKRRTSSLIEFGSYALYYILISFLYLKINIPILTLWGNIICLIIISYTYTSPYKNRFVAIFLIYLILMIVETVITLLTGYLFISIFRPNPEYSSVLVNILSNLIGFFVVLFIEGYAHIKKGSQVSTHYWLSILAISFSSLYIILTLVESKIDIMQSSIIISLLFIMIMIIFYLYDGLKASAEIQIQNTVLEQEKKYYMNQFNLMKSSVDHISSLKHDLNNHMGAISILINNDKKPEALDYISQIKDYTNLNKEYIESGNIVIDSIVNYKLDYINTTDTEIDLDISIPHDLDLKEFDMVVILGNLLDNSIEALDKLNRDRFFSLSIKYELGLLMINCRNTYDGTTLTKNNSLISSKADKDNHGYGIKNIESTLDKYNGLMKYDYTDDFFVVDILMYV